MAWNIFWIDGFDNVDLVKYKYHDLYGGVAPDDTSTYSSRSGTGTPFGYGRFCAIKSRSDYGNGYLSLKSLTNSQQQHVAFVSFNMWAGNNLSYVADRKIRVGFNYNAVEQCSLQFKFNSARGKFDVIFNSNNVDLHTWQTNIEFSSWHHVSTKLIMDYQDNAGSVTLQVDGVNLGTYSGRTARDLTQYLQGMAIYYSPGTGITDDTCFFLDDLVFADGLVNDSLLPVSRVYGALVPTSIYDGNINWRPYPVVYTKVNTINEVPPNENTYNYATTSPATDTYNTESVNGLSNVLCVSVNCIAKKGTGETTYIRSNIYYNGRSDSRLHTLYADYRLYRGIWQKNPWTDQPWTPSEANDVKIGYSAVTS